MNIPATVWIKEHPLPTIIGVTGYKGSGKSTFAKCFITQGYKSGSFATPMKRFVQDLFLWSDDTVWGASEYREKIDPRWGRSCREVLQELGTEWGRRMHPDLWVRYALRHVTGPTVFEDVRFPNEARAIQSAGGVVVRVHRDETSPPWWRTRLGRLTGGRLGIHESEAWVDVLPAKQWDGDVNGKPTEETAARFVSGG